MSKILSYLKNLKNNLNPENSIELVDGQYIIHINDKNLKAPLEQKNMYEHYIGYFLSQIIKCKHFDINKFQKMFVHLKLELLYYESGRSYCGYFKNGSFSYLKSYIAFQHGDALAHELIHMASATRDRSTGFCNINNFGYGINEGYTELIHFRYCTHSYEDSCDYHFIIIASLIEKIIGKDKTEELFFSGNLNGLIAEISKYTSKENATEIIHNIDIFYKEATSKPVDFNLRMIEIIDSLKELFINKCKLGIISKEELDSQINEIEKGKNNYETWFAEKKGISK